MNYWGGVDEITLPNLQVKNILSKARAVKGLAGALEFGDKLYLTSWPDKSLGVCKKRANTAK